MRVATSARRAYTAPGMRTLLGCLAAGVLLSASFATPAACREFDMAPPAAWVRLSPSAPSQASTGIPEGGILLERVEYQSNLALAVPQFYVDVRTRVVNEEGLEQAAQVTVSYDPSYQRLTLHDLHIERNGRSIPALDASRVRVLQRETRLEDQVFDGQQTLLLTLDDVRVGDLVVFRYTRAGTNPALAGRPAAFVYTSSSCSSRSLIASRSPSNQRWPRRPRFSTRRLLPYAAANGHATVLVITTSISTPISRGASRRA